ncbi:serine hydrolase domain-containing protein, partial [Kineococcus glutinatus]|uniref:serine hydrolase domain-containing protein n=1 Tax=Kineococcus glutinatus TaxID=1070872 RepID=UPI0031E51A5D
LAARLRAAGAGVAAQGLAAAVTVDGRTTTAAVGTADARPGRTRALTATTPQEIGSVAKSLTGLLLADAVRRGEVTPQTTLGEVHPDRDLPGELARTTLAELATHTSGLPRLDEVTLVRGLLARLSHGNPYAGHTPDGLLEAAAGTRLRGERGDHAYSNLGVALLGGALAERAGTPYPQLLRERVLDPLGMTSTAAVPQPLPAGRAHQVSANGLPAAPWVSAGSAPAGTGVWSTATDLGRLAAAVAAGRAPGQEATAARADTDQEGMRTGWGWYTAEVGGRRLLLNNGEVAGAASSVVVDLRTGDSAAVAAPSGTSTQAVAFRLLGVQAPGAGRGAPLPLVLVTAFLLVLAPLTPLSLALRRRATSPAQVPDRLRTATTWLSTAALLLALRALGAWQVVPPAAWLVSLLLAATGRTVLVARWRGASWPARRRARRCGGGAFGAALSLAVLGLCLGAGTLPG